MAVTGFSCPDGRQPQILNLLNEYALVSLSGMDNLTLIERTKLDTVLKEQELQVSGLVDTSKAIEIGRLAAARWIMTGTVIEMAESLIVFTRVIDVQTGEIVAVSQVLLPKEPELLKLL